LESVLIDSVPTFANYLRRRIEIYGGEFLYLSQESLMVFLYTYSLISNENNLIDKVFVVYPIAKESGSRNKIDIFINVEPEYYIEVKYVRPIPSEWNIPLPQHRGKLINDIIKLVAQTSPSSNKYLLLVASREFIVHLSNKPGFPQSKTAWRGRIRNLVLAVTEEKQISKENKPYLDREIKQQLLSQEKANALHILLWKIV